MANVCVVNQYAVYWCFYDQRFVVMSCIHVQKII